MAQEVLDYLEDVSYYQERARQLAQTLMKGVTFERIERDPESQASLLIALLLDDLEDAIRGGLAPTLNTRLRALGFMTGPTSSVLDEIIEDALNDSSAAMSAAATTWLEDLEDRVDAIENDESLSEETKAIILSGRSALAAAAMAGLAAVLMRGAVGAVDRVVDGVTDEHVVESAAGGTRLRWVTVVDKRRCRGLMVEACEPRHDLVKTLDEWLELGLPKSEHLNCSVWNPGTYPCRCQLVPERYRASGPVAAAEALERGRQRGRSGS